MPTPLVRPLGVALAVLLLASGCGEDDVVAPPPPGGGFPLTLGTWHMHAVNDTALPARVAVRFVGVTVEESFVDSAQLSVDPFEQTYVQRYWLRVNHTGVLDRQEFVYDEGSFVPSAGGYTFASSTRVRTFSVTVPAVGQVTTTEPMVFFVGATPVTGTYRLSRP